VVPLDWDCAVFFNSFDCGGEGARWCIGESNDASHWNRYLAKKNVFFLIFFINKHPVFGRKIIIQYHVKNGKYTLWLQSNTRRYKVLNIFNTLNISIDFIKKSAERFLGRVCRKDYILNGSVLIKCYDRKRIDIPTGVTVIGPSALSWCKSLATVTLPAGLVTIGAGAFWGCISLRTIDIPDSVTNIVGNAFSYCKNLVTINIPDSITTIGDSVFSDCKSLAAINIPDSVTVIEDDAFEGCKSLMTVDIPDSVTVIGGGVFSGCKKLKSINVGKQNKRFTDVDGVLFDKIRKRILRFPAGKQDACYTIPAGIVTIGNTAFSGCENLVSIGIPDSVTAIGHSVFPGCRNLSNITVEKQNPRFSDIDGVLFDKIEKRILRYPVGKQDACYTIPAGVITIGDYAFSGCKNLVSIDIPGSVTVIGDDVFPGCRNLSNITVEKQNQRFSGIDGVLFDMIEKRILHYPAKKQDAGYTIPAGVITIGDSAFSGCENLVTIDISDSVTAIGDFAFSDCENLKSVHLSHKIAVSEYAFDNTKTKIVYTD
jgi:hypothetical protein